MNIWIKKISFIFFLSVFVVSCNQNKQQNEPKNNNSENKKDSAFSNNLEKPNFNIFIENSVSMDGYLAPDTSGFKKIVYGLITRLKSKDIASKINLSYINDTICNFRPKHLDNDIFYLMESLNPNSLRDYACNGNRTTSFLPDILQKVISLVDSNEVNILVSDFIFSTNKGNSTKYLDEQHDKVEFSISKQLRKKEFSSIILKFNSKFEGKYFIESVIGNRSETLSCKRPFYIMIFGKQENLTNFLSKEKFSKNDDFETSYYLFTPNALTPFKSKIIRTNKKGDFEIEQPSSKMTINNAKPLQMGDKSSILQFSIASNLEFVKMDETYLSNTANYEVSPNYKLVSIDLNKDETNENLKGFTHTFTISTNDLKQKQEVFIKLKSNTPPWVALSSTNDDSNPNDVKQQSQTFGFKYLVYGIADGYKDVYDGKEQFGIKVKVSSGNYEKQGPQSKFPWWILIVLLIAIGLIINFKNKK